VRVPWRPHISRGIFFSVSDDFVAQKYIDVIDKNLFAFFAFHTHKILLFHHYIKSFGH